MQKTVISLLEGNLTDVFEFAPEREAWRCEEIVKAFQGLCSNTKPPFRIPAADNKRDIFFNSRELLARFANLPTPDQSAFFLAIRGAMKANETREVMLTVQWSATKQRLIRIKGFNGPDGDLEIELV